MVLLPSYPRAISYEATKKIIEQMEKCICKIKIEVLQGTGFFCKIPFPDRYHLLPVLITNNHIINKNLLYTKDANITLEIKEEENAKMLCLNDRIKYTNEEYDITIIEIKDEDKIFKYLELDDNIMDSMFNNNNVKREFINSTVYALQYPEGILSVSYGIIGNINEDKKYLFYHKCCTSAGAGGSPILNVENNKIIGIHTGEMKNYKYNKGVFLNQAILEFIQQNDYNDFYLKQLNKKYNLNIKDYRINKLDLRWKGFSDAGLEDLCKIDFKELKELILNNNKISDIKVLERAKYKKLEILDLSQNNISDINPLEKVNFKELKQLYLGYNNITDINIFEKTKFDLLETLLLNDNKIDKNKNASIISKLKTKIGNFEI